MGLSSPWDEYKNTQLFTNLKIKQTTLIRNTKHLQGLTQWDLVPLVPTLTYTSVNLENLRNCLVSNQCIDDDRLNKKTYTLTTTFHEPVEVSNTYVRFGYIPLIIC